MHIDLNIHVIICICAFTNMLYMCETLRSICANTLFACMFTCAWKCWLLKPENAMPSVETIMLTHASFFVILIHKFFLCNLRQGYYVLHDILDADTNTDMRSDIFFVQTNINTQFGMNSATCYRLFLKMYTMGLCVCTNNTRTFLMTHCLTSDQTSITASNLYNIL